MADNDSDLFVADTTLNLDDLAEAIKDGFTNDSICDHMAEEDKGEAWQGFLDDLKDDFNSFFNGTDYCYAVEDIENDLNERDIDDPAYLGLFDIVKDYVTANLYEDFADIEGGEEVDAYQEDGDDFIDKLCDILKGKHITVCISARAGEIE